MALYKNKFIEIDPETCSLEELKATLDKLKNLSGYYETKQLAIKTFLNSVYGATASRFFIAYNIDVAESITLQGQDLNHYSENSVNDYFSGIFQSQEEYTHIIYVPLIDFVEKYPITDKINIVIKGTQDWESASVPDIFMTEYNAKVEEFSDAAKSSVKKLFVKTYFGPYLGVKYDDVKTVSLDAGRVTKQELLTAPVFKYLTNKEKVSACIAGDTDSLISSSLIFLDKRRIKIEDAFNKLRQENDNITVLSNGQEILTVNNHTTKTYDPKNPSMPVDKNINYIMRHKVSKGKFKIKSKTGKEVIVTEDHSCIVLRNNEVVPIKAKDIDIQTDKLIEILELKIRKTLMKIQISDIESVERLEDFDDEYVYDIEVDDTHTFFANDILVHNSVYIEFGRITNQLGITDPAKASRFVVDLWRYGCGKFLEKRYEEYAKAYNCDKNLEELELEKIADTAFMTCKKHYAMSKCFAEPNIFYTPGEHISYTGLEMIQGSTPIYAKECLTDYINFILKWFGTHTEKPSFDILYERIKKYKAGLSTKTPDEICKLLRLNDYDKFILDDKNNLSYVSGSPYHVKAAATSNYFLNQPQNKKYRAKYGKIKSGDKIRVYKTTDPRYPEFAYINGKFPIEYAPAIDYDAVFEDTMLTLINTSLTILGHKPLSSKLCYTTPLF